jgi:hypothetical protein
VTRIAATRPVIRETGACYRGRPLVVEVHAGFLAMHEKGRREGVTIDWQAIYELGWKMRARMEAREKAASKRKKGRL